MEMYKEALQEKINELGIVKTADILNITIDGLLEKVDSKVKTFKNLEFENLDEFYDGVQSRLMFDNGYGISVIRHKYSYGGKLGLYEIAVLSEDGQITYNTPITNDVVGYLKPDDVSRHMVEIQEL